MTEQILLKGTEAHSTGGDGGEMKADLGSFVTGISRASVQGLDPEPNPDNLRWKVTCGPTTICIVELTPRLHQLQWIAPNSPVPFGPTATYTPRTLALPYVILKVPFVKERFAGRAELFYRNEPLRSISDQLYWPNLLNVSPNAHGCTAWLCTQYLGTEQAAPGITAGLNAIVHHLIGGPFNLSSEHHEGSSSFGKAKKDGLDKSVTDVDRWEAESKKRPTFVLNVPWKPVGFTVADLIEKELTLNGTRRNLGSVAELVNVLVTSRNGKKGA